MFGSSNVLGSFNNDVLQAQPENDDSKRRLIEEIKNRAKGCLPSKNYPEAVALYSKAIEVCPVADVAAKAILHANRSMCRLSMNLIDGAIEDAQEAITLDADYLKGYYRLGMAYSQAGKYTKAREAFAQGLTKKPDDKELRTQLEIVEKKAATSASNSSSSSSSKASSITSSTTTTTTTTVPSKASSTSSSAGRTPEVAKEDDDEDLNAANMRGYRKTADGKVTTFFNHDLDEQTKALIGDIAPKKVEPAKAVEPINKGEGSAWNAAGTYEERILTPWALETLKNMLSSIAIVLSANDISAATRAKVPGEEVASVLVEVTAVEDVSGDAQVTLARGKKKHLCDMSATVKWRLTLTTAAATESVEGETKVMDISADGDFEIMDATVSVINGQKGDRRALPAHLAAIFSETLQGSSRGLKPAVVNALADFCRELKQK